jgi:ArsR family transcriptional regulator, arsenate/arsenite/antimonite-responsive transcriptional repressor
MSLLRAKKKSTSDVVAVYKALADKTRLGIALILYSAKKECTCGELASHFNLSQPAFSHHCQKLVQAGIISMRKEGATHFLCINEDNLKQSGINLNDL